MSFLENNHLPENKSINLVPLDTIQGFDVRPGFYRINGAMAIPCGINFTIHSHYATSCSLLLFHRQQKEPYAILEFPESYKIGNVYSMIVFGLNMEEFEYAYRVKGPYIPERGILFDDSKYLLDPYAKAVVGQSLWGMERDKADCYKARVVRDDFDWGNFKAPHIPMSDLIIYELHTRGFTKHQSSHVKYPGTFAGLAEKIPYLKDLGINCVELMPIFEFDEMRDCRNVDGNKLLDYWGYNTICFFAPNTSYAAGLEYNREGNELKQMIKTFNENGMEVILDVVFNHTAEGDQRGPFFSFKGFDNNIYYMLTPDGKYYNFSGCGNTLNCNHPIVQQLILECLRYWVTEYRISGFRFDLASILGRNEDGSPMSSPPLLQNLAFDPILGSVKLIAEAWDAGGLYQVGSFPAWNRWAEWNGKYRDDMRSFLKGDGGYARAAVERMTGSKDLYNPDKRGENASVNFITCHDGFTLYDLYSYNEKHNEANGWNNTDGTDDNRSWNCGWEGETDNPQVLQLRYRLIKNAFAVLMCSRGTPMFLAGDEFGNTQSGNNNAYCQDNEISWLDWTLLEKHKETNDFFKFLIQFRRKHKVLRSGGVPAHCGLPSVSFHSSQPWEEDFHGESRHVGVLFAGQKEDLSSDELVYVTINAHWECAKFTLPDVKNYVWVPAFDTGRSGMEKNHNLDDEKNAVESYVLMPRSVVAFTALPLNHK